MKFSYFLLTAFFLLAGAVNGQKDFTLSGEQGTDGALLGSSVGFVVTDMLTGEILASENPDLLLAPASVAKLFTTASALEILGSGYRYETRFLLQGTLDPVQGVLDGNLVVRGGGDPTTGSVYFRKNGKEEDPFATLAEILKIKGIKRITGSIVPDVSAFGEWSVPRSWMWEDIGNYYGATPGALNILDNTVRLLFNSSSQAGEQAVLTGTDPDLPGISWISEVSSGTNNRDLAYVYGSPWGTRRYIRGTIPAGRTGFGVKASMPNPAEVYINLLRRRLEDAGISAGREIQFSISESEALSLHTIWSPPVAEICSVLNHESVNLLAESLVMQLAYKSNGYGDHDAGMELMRSFIREKITGEPFFLEDGSGLSRFSAVTARQLNNLLLHMSRSNNAGAFRSGLPVAGAGTLRSFRTSDFPGYTLRAKSGSMTRVRAYAGYLVCQSGREVAFSVMVNNFPGTQSEVFRSLERFLKEVRSTF